MAWRTKRTFGTAHEQVAHPVLFHSVKTHTFSSGGGRNQNGKLALLLLLRAAIHLDRGVPCVIFQRGVPY